MKDKISKIFEEDNFNFNLLTFLLKGTENTCSISRKMNYKKRSTHIQRKIQTLKEEGYIDGDRRTLEGGNKGYSDGYKLNIRFLFWCAEKMKVPFSKEEKKLLKKIFDKFDLNDRQKMALTAIKFQSVKKSYIFSFLKFFESKNNASLKKYLPLIMKLMVIAQPEYVDQQEPLTKLISDIEKRFYDILSKKRIAKYEKWMSKNYEMSKKERLTLHRVNQTFRVLSQFQD